MEHTLEGVVLEEVLLGAGCLAALIQSSKDRYRNIKRKRQTWVVYHVEPRKPRSIYKWLERYKLELCS